MLDSLDTLIGFALIFSVVSLLVTIVVQIIMSVLNLRGKNLAWGIAEAFAAIDPALAAEVKGRGKNLADHLLEDPLISDWQLGSKVRSATAVRANELFDLLHRIAIGKKPGTPPEIRKDVIALFKSLGVPASVFEIVADEQKKLEKLEIELRGIITTLPDGPTKEALVKKAVETTAQLANAASFAEDSALRWAAQGEKAIQEVYRKFEKWFEIGQERTQEWFTTHARIITAVLGLLFAFVLQLDTVEIYKLISSNRELRASLVAQVKPVIEQGEKILKESPTVMKASVLAAATNWGPTFSKTLSNDVAVAVTDTPEAVKRKMRDAFTNSVFKSLDTVLQGVPDQEATGQHEVYKNALNDAFKKWHAMLADTNLSNALVKANLVADTETNKLAFRQRVITVLEAELARVLETFDHATLTEVQARIKVSAEDWNALKGSLDKTGFDLFPKDGWRWTVKGEKGQVLKNSWWSHLHGMLCSALLLSLGAPFWFNTLKSLASLRSSVAKNISEEDKAEQKKPNPGANKAPPTVT